MRRFLFTFLCLTIWAVVLPAVSQAVSFTGLGFLPGGNASQASAVSADGSTVAGSGNNPTFQTTDEAFRWTAGSGMVGLGFLSTVAPFDSAGGGLSADGSAVVGSSSDSSPAGQGFRWTAGSGMVGLGVLPGGISSAASGVSADGSVVVGIGIANVMGSQQASRWTASTGMVGLGFLLPGDTRSGAQGVSADGSVVVGLSGTTPPAPNPPLSQAFRWTASTGMVGLGFLPGDNNSDANAVSADGSVVVGVSSTTTGNQAFRWTSGGGMVGLGFLPGTVQSGARAVSANGSVVVGASNTASGAFQAFIWDPTHGMRSVQQVLTADGINLTGWTLASANGISADGSTIVGSGTDPSGQQEAWIANLAAIPEPGTGLLVLMGLMGLAVARRRHHSV